jgi:excisionase family DNA binding protein
LSLHDKHVGLTLDRLAWRENEAAEALGISLTTFLELVAEGKMPKPVRIRPRLPRYDCEDVRKAWRTLKEAQISPNDANEWDQ